MKKIFMRNAAVLLSAFMVVCLAGVFNVHASGGGHKIKSLKQNEVTWKGKDDISEPELKDDVYQIASGAELAWFAKKINESTGATLKAILIKDVDLGDQLWTPIGDKLRSEFKGEFDGNGKTVSGLKIETDQPDWALFGHVTSGTVKNLTVKGSVKSTSTNTISNGGTAGIIGSIAGKKNQPALIENCVSYVDVTGGTNVGGVVGMAAGYPEAGTVKNCVNYGNVDGKNNVGGLVGRTGSPVTVTDSYNRGNATVSGWKAAGVIGYMENAKTKVINCYTTGSVSGKDAHPVIGKKEGGSVSNCYYLSSLPQDPNATPISEEDLKEMKFADPIAAFVKAPDGVNDGFPILEFQKPAEEPAADIEQLNKAIEQAIAYNEELLKNDAYKDVSGKLKAEIEKAQALAGSGIKKSEQSKVDAAVTDLNAAVENAKAEKTKIDKKIADDAEKARLAEETDKLLKAAEKQVNDAVDKVAAAKAAKEKASKVAENIKDSEGHTDKSKEALKNAAEESGKALKAYENAEKTFAEAQSLYDEMSMLAAAVKDAENADAAKSKADEALAKAASIKEKTEAIGGFIEEVTVASANAEKSLGEYKDEEEKYNKGIEEEKAKEEARKKAEAEARKKGEAAKKAAEKAQKEAAEQAAKKAADERKAKEAQAKVPSDEVAEKAAENGKISRIEEIKVKGDVKKGTLTLLFKTEGSDTNYRVAYRKNGSAEWKYSWTAGLGKSEINGMRKNGLYEVKVAAYRNREGVWTRGAWSDTKNVFYANAKIKVKRGKRSFTAKLTKVKNISGLTVKYSPKKNMRKAKHKVFSASVFRKTGIVKVGKLKKKSNCFVTAMPFKKYKGEIYYGIESKVKKVRIK